MIEKKTRKKKAVDTGVPDEVNELLSDEDLANSINETHAQGLVLEKVANLMTIIEIDGKVLEKIFSRSGFTALASHFKGLRDRSAQLAKEIEKTKPHGRLKFEPGDFTK